MSPHHRWVVALLASVVFVAVLSGTMINVALPFIGRSFQVGEATYGWIITGYTLTFAIFSAIHGSLADIYGIRRLYLFGLVTFGAGAVAVALSSSIELAIVLRLLQGAGAAALPSLGSTIIARLLPPQQRGGAMGVIVAMVGVASSIGPFLGGVLLEWIGWRGVFFFSAVALLAVPIALRLLPAELDERRPQPFDFIGASLLGVGSGGLMYSFTLLADHGFSSAFIVGSAASLAVLLGFALWIRGSIDRFVKPALFADPRYVAGIVVAALSNATRFGTIVLVPILLVVVEHLSPLEVGFVLFPGALAIAFLSTPAGRWSDRVGPRRPVSVGTAAVALGIAVIAVTAGASDVGVAIGMTLYGVGFALIQTPLFGATSQILPKEDAGVGLGMFLMIFFLGAAFGVALTLAVVELQAPLAASWLGLELNGGARFSNAVLLLMVLSAISAVFLPRLSGSRLAPAAPPA